MSLENKTSDHLDQVREIVRSWESEPQAYDPELARTYAGQWVVIQQGLVVAHAPKGSELVQAGYLRKHPGSRLLYVPTAEHQEGVWVLHLASTGARVVENRTLPYPSRERIYSPSQLPAMGTQVNILEESVGR
jgi:hypothetical protein